MLEKFLDKIDFESYEDFMENFHIKVPENFNFGYDVVDEWARLEPNKKALLWYIPYCFYSINSKLNYLDHFQAIMWK